MANELVFKIYRVWQEHPLPHSDSGSCRGNTRPPHSSYQEGWATERLKPKSHALSLKPERTATSPSFRPRLLPAQSLASGAANPRVVRGVFVNMAFSLSCLLGGRVCAAVARCGFATRGVTIPGSISREPDPDFDWEPEERELQEVERYRLLPGPSA